MPFAVSKGFLLTPMTIRNSNIKLQFLHFSLMFICSKLNSKGFTVGAPPKRCKEAMGGILSCCSQLLRHFFGGGARQRRTNDNSPHHKQMVTLAAEAPAHSSICKRRRRKKMRQIMGAPFFNSSDSSSTPVRRTFQLRNVQSVLFISILNLRA